MKFLKSLCITLAFVLLAGSVGFGTYKLLNRKPGGGVVSADNAAKIYNVDVKKFDYDFTDVEEKFVNATFIADEFSGYDLTNQGHIAAILNKILVNRFVYKNPDSASAVDVVYENGYFTVEYPGSKFVTYKANGSSCFNAYWQVVDGGLVITLSKNSGSVSCYDLETLNAREPEFTYSFKPEYVTKNVICDTNAFWFNVYKVKSENIKAEMSKAEMAGVISEMFATITDNNSGVTYDSVMAGYISSPMTYSRGWYGFTQPGTTAYPHSRIKILAKFVEGYVYICPFYYEAGNCPNSLTRDPFIAYGDKDVTANAAMNYSFTTNEGYEMVGIETRPFLDSPYFYAGVQVNSTNTEYSFSNLNQAREMLGIKEEDGAFSMTKRVDHEDYIEYVFNLKTDNMSLDFNVKVYKNNVCVLDYNRYYYVDNNGQVQTFSVTDITKPDSPFVYYYETQTHYYYLRRVDVLTSYQLKISKEILTIELNKSEQSA